MTEELAVGSRWRSVVDEVEVMVVQPPASEIVQLECGGYPMVGAGSDVAFNGKLDPKFAEGTRIGKRFVHARTGLELLCTRGGEGSLAVDGDPLEIKSAKALPASD